MFTRTRENETSTAPQIIRVPKNIQKDIQERGFHLYKWISPDEVKLSIERDFLSALKYVWIPLAITSILFTFITGLNPAVFFITIILGMSWVFAYLLFLSIRRSRLLSKSAFVIMTDSSISLWGKVRKLSEVSQLKSDIDTVSETFEEDLFGESRLKNSKKWLMQEVMDQLFWWYSTIFNMFDGSSRIRLWNSKDSAGWVMLILALYTAYIAIMASIYFIWVLFLLLLWKLFTWLNTAYLIKRGQSVIKINQLFWELDNASEDIKEQRKSLKTLIWKAQDNEWKDGLLLEINAGIESINTSAQQAVLEVLSLRNTISNSRYKDMFSFSVYNGWIKKQISKPLEDILSLLQSNKEVIENSLEEIDKQISSTQKIDYISVLKLQKKRLKMQLKTINEQLPMLENSIASLR